MLEWMNSLDWEGMGGRLREGFMKPIGFVLGTAFCVLAAIGMFTVWTYLTHVR